MNTLNLSDSFVAGCPDVFVTVRAFPNGQNMHSNGAIKNTNYVHVLFQLHGAVRQLVPKTMKIGVLHRRSRVQYFQILLNVY